MNVFDLAVIVLFVAAVLIGLNSGAIPQLAGLLGALGGGALALAALPLLERPLKSLDPPVSAFAVLAGMLFLVGIGEAIGSAIGQSVAMRLRGGVLGTLDRLFGGVVGGAQALLIVWLIGGLLAAGPMRGLAVQAQTSFVVRGLNAILPAPTEIAAELARLLDDTGLPDLFVGLEPLPAAPVDVPTDPTARAIAASAQSSTVKVSAATCEYISTGSGFVIARGYVVTNAHVVAGATTIRVLTVEGALRDAVAVFDDPELDVALLWVPRLDAPALRFAAADPAPLDIEGSPGESYHAARERLLSAFERRYLTRLVQQAGGNMSKAARIAGVDRTTLYRLMERHGLERGLLATSSAE